MPDSYKGPVFIGLDGIELKADQIDFGHGILLRKTYAHLFSTFLMAFKPAPPGSHHPGPWKNANGGDVGIDVTAEFCLPEKIPYEGISNVSLARIIVSLMRLWASPLVSGRVVTTRAISELANLPNNAAHVAVMETKRRAIHFGAPPATDDSLEWVRLNWENAIGLLGKSATFRLALDALDSVHFIENASLCLVSIWGALEGLFSPSKTELRFRVSANIATFLEPVGQSRHELQKAAIKLYDARSSAAHGGDELEIQHLTDSFDLLRRVLIKIIEENHVPTKDEQERRLFGA